jgi:Rps23 Pro-64 3,4-dihydroxylase Tpa1-like proline 4-hydroxylase
MLNPKDWKSYHDIFITAEPFNHVVIDDFFANEIVEKLVEEFLPYNSEHWRGQWDNQVENKKLHNVWDLFPEVTYRTFTYLNSKEFVKILKQITGCKQIYTDIGLNGGGLHSHKSGGHLNIHLDYVIHPKLKLKRKFNLIVYITPNWKKEYGGGLELWSHDSEKNLPGNLVTTVENKFNRAVIFDTTQNSWHGLPEKLDCPEGVTRNSLAIYYLTQPGPEENTRMKALFAPYKDQINDPEVLELIKKRADVNQVKKLYRQ